MSTLTPEQMLRDIALHARCSVVHVEPKTAALWHELIGDALCGAAFDVGLAQADAERLRDARAAHMSNTDRRIAEEREACARLVEHCCDGSAMPISPSAVAEQIRGRR